MEKNMIKLESNGAKSKSLWLWILIILAAFAPQLYKLFLPIRDMFPMFFSDDTFYYYKTAINIRNGLGSTFDTMNFTNGYHPLWMLICVLAAYFTTNLYHYIYVILIIDLAICVLLTAQIIRMFGKQLGFLFTAFLIFLMNWQKKSSCAIFSGLETALYLLLIMVVVEKIVNMSWKEKKQLFVMGILLGTTFWARTSFILFAPIFLGYVIYKIYKDRSIKIFQVAFYMIAPALLLVLPYMFWNYYMTGHFEQISGLSKNLMFKGGFTSMDFFISSIKEFAEQISLILQPRIFTLIPATLFGYFIFFFIRHKNKLAFLRDPRLLLILAFSICEMFYYFVEYGKYIRGWHTALAAIVLQLLFVYASKIVYEYNAGRGYIIIPLRVCFLLIGVNCFFNTPYYLYKYPQPHDSYIAANWIRENLPKDCTIGVWDAGIVGYFSERNVVNLDGLINGVELYEYRENGKGVIQYIIDNKLDYIGNTFHTRPYLLNSILAPGLELVYKVTDQHEGKGRGEESTWFLWKINYEKL